MVVRSDSSLDFVKDRQLRQDGPSLLIQPAIDNTPLRSRQHQHLQHHILITPTAPRCLVAQQICYLHIIHNECCRNHAGYDFLTKTMLLLEIGMGSKFLGIFTPSEPYRAMTNLETGKEILGGCVLVVVPVSGSSGWNDFRGGCIFPPSCWRNLTSSPFILYIFFLAQICAIFYKSIMCTGLGGWITGWIKHMHIYGSLACYKIPWMGSWVCNFSSVSAMGM